MSVISILSLIALISCGKAPSDPPTDRTGVIKFFAQLDSLSTDNTGINNFNVIFDEDTMGLQPNPLIINDVRFGEHFLRATKADPDTTKHVDFSIIKSVIVSSSDTTRDSIVLSKFAPQFTLQNLNDEEIVLKDYRDKVILLVFFSHT